jgi:hypothetical protein
MLPGDFISSMVLSVSATRRGGLRRVSPSCRSYCADRRGVGYAGPAFFTRGRAMRVFLIIAMLAMLGGCAGSGPSSTEIRRSAANDAKCQSYGAKPGSSNYIRCRATRYDDV